MWKSTKERVLPGTAIQRGWGAGEWVMEVKGEVQSHRDSK